MDWMRLTRSKDVDLSGATATAYGVPAWTSVLTALPHALNCAGLGGGRPRQLSLAELAQHRTAEDCWTAVQGRVYNVTHYLPFHPGGQPLLLAVAGKDGTALFAKYHAWVNVHFMLAPCLVGTLEGALEATAAGVDEEDDSDDET